MAFFLLRKMGGLMMDGQKSGGLFRSSGPYSGLFIFRKRDGRNYANPRTPNESSCAKALVRPGENRPFGLFDSLGVRGLAGFRPSRFRKISSPLYGPDDRKRPPDFCPSIINSSEGGLYDHFPKN